MPGHEKRKTYRTDKQKKKEALKVELEHYQDRFTRWLPEQKKREDCHGRQRTKTKNILSRLENQ